MMRKAGRAARPTVATYRDDPLHPSIERAVARILANGKVVAPVDVLVGMGLLAPEKLEDWRRGRYATWKRSSIATSCACRASYGSSGSTPTT